MLVLFFNYYDDDNDDDNEEDIVDSHEELNLSNERELDSYFFVSDTISSQSFTQLCQETRLADYFYANLSNMLKKRLTLFRSTLTGNDDI